MATESILLAIDGTGSKDWIRKDGLNSHVKRFYMNFTGVKSHYLDGPSGAGGDVDDITTDGIRQLYRMIGELVRTKSSIDDIHINLVGHSRGGFIAIKIANILANSNEFLRVTTAGSAERVNYLNRTLGSAMLPSMKVNFIGLYDAVERSPVWGGKLDLPNVTRVAHAIRPRHRTRLSFGGMDIDTPHAVQESFDTSHGGVGGDPGFFGSLKIGAEDPYCNARHLVGDVDDINFFKWAYGASWGVTQNNMEDIKRFWQNSTRADLWIREQATSSNVPLGTPSPHYPYQNDMLGKRLKTLANL